MQENTVNSKRIAKNTLLLYVRMLFLMLISLYTSRVILNALGVEDYGIYNVVGGVVTMFSMLSGSLSAAISRFLTFELGKGNAENLRKVFSSSVSIQACIALIIIFLAETVGLWFLNCKMVIPDNRIVAANWCFQFSIMTFVINLISVPYNAAIIAHERMSAFAYISIWEAIGKLLVAWSIVLNPIDRLVFFGAMVAVIAWIIRLVYVWYCKRYFKECYYQFVCDSLLLKRMFSFAGWNFIGASSAVLRDQGVNILLNLFFGTSVNAARGIAVKINSVVTGFVQNFMVALNPQITKSYASGDRYNMMKLAYQGARFSYYILLILSLPIILNARSILVLWLGIVPEHTVLFVQLILIAALCECISNPLITIMLATGNIRNYQIVVGGLQMMNLPVAYIFLYYGAIPESVMLVSIILGQCCLLARLIMLRKMVGLSARQYLLKVYFNVLSVTMIAIIIPVCVFICLDASPIINMVSSSMTAFVTTFISVLFVGCNQNERLFVYSKLSQVKDKLLK